MKIISFCILLTVKLLLAVSSPFPLSQLKHLQRCIAAERKLCENLERARKEQLTPLVQSMNELSMSIKAEEMQIRHEIICKSGYRVTY